MAEKKTATWYRTDGQVETVSPANGTDFTLEELQKFCGGTIDVQDLPGTKEIIVVKDDGKNIGLPKNKLATEIWKKAYQIEKYELNNDQLIVGDALVCEKGMVK